MAEPVNLTRANLLLDRVIDSTNDNESTTAETILVSGLRAAGFRPGDLILIGRESPIHEQFLKLIKEHRQVLHQLAELQAKNLEVELARHDRKVAKPIEMPIAPPMPTHQPKVDEPLCFDVPKPPKQHPFEWNEMVQRMLVGEWLAGHNINKIAEKLSTKLGASVTANMVTGQLVNGVPPACLDVRIAPCGEPTSWLELWLIGSILYRGTVGTQRNRGWRKILSALGLKSGTGPPINPNLFDIQEAVDQLRIRAIDTAFKQGRVIELAQQANAGGMSRKAIAEAVHAIQLLGYENTIFDQMIADGQVFRSTDGSPLTVDEVTAMTNVIGSNAAMTRFIITHIQKDIGDLYSLDGLTPSECIKLRQRFDLEKKWRNRNQRYAKFSIGLALLEKRRSKLARNTENRISTQVAKQLSESWFGVEDAHYCIAQLCGFDEFTVRQAFDGMRPLSQQLCETIGHIAIFMNGLDPDDPTFEAMIARRSSGDFG